MKSAAVVALVALVLALAWSAVVRAPLIANAPAHLDSDLAVDGLTLRDAVNGHWRWHYPGTPHMGSAAVLLSYPQALGYGATPETLTSGGTVAYLLLIGGVFATAWLCRGPRVAAWSLVPLAFASTGTLWLTGRITGGHMLAAAWSAWAWAILAWDAKRQTRLSGGLVGGWFWLGWWHDSMFLMTIIGMVPALCLVSFAWRGLLRRREVLGGLAAFVACAFIAGTPRTLGRLLEPYDAYDEQFAWSLQPELLKEHSRILLLDCLPRLVAGHRLPGLEADPDPDLLGGGAPVARAGRPGTVGVAAVATTALGLGTFAAGFLALAWRAVRRPSEAEKARALEERAREMVLQNRPNVIVQRFRFSPPPWTADRAVALGLLVTSTALLAAFVVNRNIFNSDNYRYLVLLLIPGALGFGALMDALASRATGGKVAAAGIATAFALAFAADASAWYRRLGWIDDRWTVVRRAVDDPALRWLNDHPEVEVFAAGYWDAYRLAFLADRPVKGAPHPIYPNRFPEWSRDLPGGRPTILIARSSPEDQRFLQQALSEGGRVLFHERGTTVATWPVGSK